MGCTLACFLNIGLWKLGIRIRNGAYTAFLSNVEYRAATLVVAVGVWRTPRESVDQFVEL